MYCHYLICEHKFYARYARKNYATPEINPKKELVSRWVKGVNDTQNHSNVCKATEVTMH